jgi:hypothetical protein
VKDVIYPLIGLLLLNVAILVVWTVHSPLEWTREVVDSDVWGRVTESRGSCTSENVRPFAISLVVLDIGAFCVVCYQSFLARHIATEFAESESIGSAISAMALVSFVGVYVPSDVGSFPF